MINGELDLSNDNTQNVTNIEYMFYNCASLSSLDLFNFNTQNITIKFIYFNFR